MLGTGEQKMENLNAEQIRKALELCLANDIFDSLCEKCAYQNNKKNCMDCMLHDALSLITSQEQKIKELTEENERLVRANSAINNAVLAVDRKAKADTVRKMCQQIKEHFPYDADSGLYVVLDQIAKEMLEREK